VALTHQQVKDIAELAKLDLTDAEIDLYAEQLGDILGYFERLQELDTAHIPPTASVLPLRNVWRSDEPGQPLAPAEVIANTADSMDNQFRVSAVLDGE